MTIFSKCSTTATPSGTKSEWWEFFWSPEKLPGNVATLKKHLTHYYPVDQSGASPFGPLFTTRTTSRGATLWSNHTFSVAWLSTGLTTGQYVVVLSLEVKRLNGKVVFSIPSPNSDFSVYVEDFQKTYTMDFFNKHCTHAVITALINEVPAQAPAQVPAQVPAQAPVQAPVKDQWPTLPGTTKTPAPAPAKVSAKTLVSDTLEEWLANNRLSNLGTALTKLGATVPVDLLDIDEDDVASLNLKSLEKKRLFAALSKLQDE